MYQKDNILPDALFAYANHFNIQLWLEERNCFLKDFILLGHKFSDYLICMCETMGLNPKLVLVSLQREQGLIAMSSEPGIEVLNRALGVGMYDDSDNASFYGFQTQVDGCIDTYLKWFRRVIHELDIDGEKLLPKNAATYALYMYTPHFAAAKLTYDIWRGWWPADLA
jgi:hypothetical protein